MSTAPSQVVVGFDFTASATAALERAIALATRAPFHVLHIVCAIDPHFPPPAVPAPDGVDYRYAEAVQRAITLAIEIALQENEASSRIHFFVHARIGSPADEVLAVARDVGADLIIVGSKGNTGLTRLVLGSVSEKIVREAGCTVEVARAKTYPDVALEQVVTVEPHLHYARPHRYVYEDRRLNLRPSEWPLY